MATGQVRILNNWSICTRTNKEGSWRYLIGFTVGGNKEVPLTPGTNIRFTETSPIKEVKGNAVTTESGTVYMLEDPSSSYKEQLAVVGFVYDKENPIPSIMLAIIEA